MNKKNRKRKRTAEDWLVDGVAYVFALFLMVSILLPFMQVITISMSPASVVNATGFHLIPLKFDFSGYEQISTDPNFWRSYLVTIVRTVIGTAAGVLVTVLTAYPLAKTNLPYRRGLMMFVVFTMYFSGGMIPKYLLIKNIHLTNHFMVYILPCLMTGFALIITRNFFMGIPPALEESAKIDGAGHLRIFFQIVFPLIKPSIATLAVLKFVWTWNDYQTPLIFLSNRMLFTIQLGMKLFASESGSIYSLTMAAAVSATLPLILLFLCGQRYIIEGIASGAVKG